MVALLAATSAVLLKFDDACEVIELYVQPVVAGIALAQDLKRPTTFGAGLSGDLRAFGVVQTQYGASTGGIARTGHAHGLAGFKDLEDIVVFALSVQHSCGCQGHVAKAQPEEEIDQAQNQGKYNQQKTHRVIVSSTAVAHP